MSLISKTVKAAALAVTALGTTAALAEAIVVRSTGPSARIYPPGKALADQSRIALKAGDTITVLDGRGTRVFTGPGVFSTTASNRAAPTAVNALLRNTGTRVGRTGATRGATPASVRNPNVWYLDARKSGTMCVADATKVTLWRPATPAAASLTVTRISDGKAATVSFAGGQSQKAWPASLPVSFDSRYMISGDGLPTPSSIKLVNLGLNPEGLENTTAALIRSGCQSQVDLIIETITLASDDTPVG